MVKKRYKEAGGYLAATFAITWVIWLGAYAASTPACTLPLSTDWLVRLGTMVPSAAGLVMTRIYDGTEGVKALLRALIRCKASLVWWVYATALFPLILLVSSAVFLVAGGILPQAQFPPWFIPVAFLYILVFMGPLGEELGWRGFLLGRLIQRQRLVRAGGVLGIIWSAWHIPLFFIPGTIQFELAKMGFTLACAGYCIYTVCISLLIAVLYARTKGNLLLCMIFHTVCNLSLGIVPLILERSGAAVLLAVLILSTALIVKRNGEKRMG